MEKSIKINVDYRDLWTFLDEALKYRCENEKQQFRITIFGPRTTLFFYDKAGNPARVFEINRRNIFSEDVFVMDSELNLFYSMLRGYMDSGKFEKILEKFLNMEAAHKSNLHERNKEINLLFAEIGRILSGFLNDTIAAYDKSEIMELPKIEAEAAKVTDQFNRMMYKIKGVKELLFCNYLHIKLEEKLIERENSYESNPKKDS